LFSLFHLLRHAHNSNRGHLGYLRPRYLLNIASHYVTSSLYNLGTSNLTQVSTESREFIKYAVLFYHPINCTTPQQTSAGRRLTSSFVQWTNVSDSNNLKNSWQFDLNTSRCAHLDANHVTVQSSSTAAEQNCHFAHRHRWCSVFLLRDLHT
jgi:hypothetical protein